MAQSRRMVEMALASLLAAVGVYRGQAGGVTAIAHGLDGSTEGWITSMAEAIPGHTRFLGTSATCYKLYFYSEGSGYRVGAIRTSGMSPRASDSGQIVLKLDWSQLSDGDSYNTYQIASAFSTALQMPNLIPELGRPLAEQPMHLIGHSRGGSLVCEISRQLGTNGLWVDHVTTLDPHPLCDAAFSSLERLWYSAVDAPAQTYMNVLFADNYYQEDAWFVYGKSVTGAFNELLVDFSGGYSSGHSDMHLFYHATIDLDTPCFDREAWVNSNDRSIWFAPAEQKGQEAGFRYSRIGGGNRLSTLQPRGPYMIRDGYNQTWDLGAGITPNRIALPSNSGMWPNLILVNGPQDPRIRQGQTLVVTNVFQWAKAGGGTGELRLFLDSDTNPYNENEHALTQRSVPASTSASYVNVGTLSATINGRDIPSGVYAVGAWITAQGITRFMYAPEIVQIQPSNGCAYAISPKQSFATAAASSAVVNVAAASGCDWAATPQSSWIHATRSGFGNGSCSVTIDRNDNLTARTGSLSIGGQTVTVTQAGAIFALPSGGTNVGSRTADHSFAVSNSDGCQWAASASVSWLQTSSQGYGNGRINYRALTNTATSFRVGSIRVGGQAYQVTQAPSGFEWHTSLGWLYSAGNGWYHAEGLGWIWCVQGQQWFWSTALQGWLANPDLNSRTLWSTQFRWLTPSATDSCKADTTSIGAVYVGMYNGTTIPDGWVVSERFGYVWANGDGTWFWSEGRKTWLGVTPDGGIWSVKEGRFL